MSGFIWLHFLFFFSAFFVVVVSLKQSTYSLHPKGEMGASLVKIRIVALTL